MSQAPTGTLSLIITTHGPRGSSNQRSDQGDPNVYSAKNYEFDVDRVTTVCYVANCTQADAATIAAAWRQKNGEHASGIWTGEVKL